MSRYAPLIVVVAIILIAGGVVFYGMQPGSQPPSTAQPPAVTPTPAPATPAQSTAEKKPQGVNVEGAEIEQRDPTGAIEWKVTAGGQLEFDKDRQTITGTNVRFEMLQKDKLPVVLVAPEFHANYDTRRLTFAQGVRGQMSDGSAHFRVNHLVYDFDSKKLLGTGGAHFVQGKYEASASKIVLDARAKKVRLSGGVKFMSHGG